VSRHMIWIVRYSHTHTSECRYVAMLVVSTLFGGSVCFAMVMLPWSAVYDRVD